MRPRIDASRIGGQSPPELNSGGSPHPRCATCSRAGFPGVAERRLPMDQLDDIVHQDLDPTETQEWVDSLNAVINHDGTERAP